MLTVGGTFVEAFTTSPPWLWSEQGVQIQSLGVTFQVGAVLLTGCMGGKNAGALSQLAYVVLGLIWLPIFSQGGGWSYLIEPTFGYILGFIPGAWLCGYIAFTLSPKLENLGISCFGGLLIIHLVGAAYLLALTSLGFQTQQSLVPAIWEYSLDPLFPGHFVVVCAVAVLAYALRHLLFY